MKILKTSVDKISGREYTSILISDGLSRGEVAALVGDISKQKKAITLWIFTSEQAFADNESILNGLGKPTDEWREGYIMYFAQQAPGDNKATWMASKGKFAELDGKSLFI